MITKHGTKPLAALAVAFILAVGVGAQAGRHPDRTYRNARFGYAVTYPADVLRGRGEAGNGDGQTFTSTGKAATLRVWGAYNILRPGATVADFYRADAQSRTASQPKRVVSYKVLHAPWYVVSGRDGSREFYQKVYVVGDTVCRLDFTYPAAQRRKYGPIAATVSRSFRLLEKR